MDKISYALEWAARAHRGQVRKGSSVPYLVHPLNVAKILIHQGCEEDLVIAGLLHDTVEDTTVEDTDVEQEDLELRVRIQDRRAGSGGLRAGQDGLLGVAQRAYDSLCGRGIFGRTVDCLCRQTR